MDTIRGNEWSAVTLIEEVSNAMVERGINATLRDRKLTR